MKNEPNIGQNGTRNRYKIKKYIEKWMPKLIQKFATFQKVQKIEQMGSRCDFVPKMGPRVEPDWWIFGSHGPQRAAPSKRTRHKKERSRRKKEKPRKKE